MKMPHSRARVPFQQRRLINREIQSNVLLPACTVVQCEKRVYLESAEKKVRLFARVVHAGKHYFNEKKGLLEGKRKAWRSSFAPRHVYATRINVCQCA